MYYLQPFLPGMAMELSQLEKAMEDIREQVWALAQEHQGDNNNLLCILRFLEKSHQEIRETLFLASLPNTRHGLANLLKEIEEKGGWPYIERMRIPELLASLPEESFSDSDDS